MRRRQRVAVYGICTDDDDRILLVRAAQSLTVRGRWFLPGGGLEHGEDPVDGLGREVTEETGLQVIAQSLLGVISDTATLPDATALHTVRIIYRVERWRGTLRAEASGSSDAAVWTTRAELASVPVMPYVTEALARFG
jgi:ADP-ribose pyrophosphatase YjhB (NUDIX family)